MEHKYALNEFWVQKLDFKRRVDASAFANLHEVRSIINNTFLLAVRNNLHQKDIAEWQENLVFVEYLASNLGSQSHSWAMQKLKELFGGKQGMSSGKKSLADKIVRQTPQRTQGMVPQMHLPAPPQQEDQRGMEKEDTLISPCNRAATLTLKIVNYFPVNIKIFSYVLGKAPWGSITRPTNMNEFFVLRIVE